MKHAPFLVLLVAGGLLGWFAPDLAGNPPTAPEKAAAVEASPTARLDVAGRDQWLSGEVVLPRMPDGHFYADVTVDDASLNMLVDTGASAIALTGEDAEAIGLTWEQGEVRPIAHGANGPIYGVVTKLDRVQLGELEARDVDAMIVPEGLGISLLGQSFLSQIKRVEIEGEQMLLGG